MTTATSHFSYSPIPLPPSADPKYFNDFGRKVDGFDPASMNEAQLEEIIDKLYEHGILLFKNVTLTPKQQYEMTHAFDPQTTSYGHGNNKTGSTKASILHPDLKTIPHQPQVQLIGNGKVPGEYEGLDSPQLKHPHHKTFHKSPVSEEDEEAGITRFYRWHIDAALYALSPPKVTTLYAVKVPSGDEQTCRYDDGTGDEVKVPLGGTVFVSGKNMFDILPAELKSLAVRTKVKYAPHPYVWMSKAHALPTGLGIENEDLELPLEELPEWEESKVKLFPMCWKNPTTGGLHIQVHPCGAKVLVIEPLPAGASKEGALYPDGGEVNDLTEVRELLYRIQRPGIAPELVYPHGWDEKDLVLFHNRGLLHSVVGAFKPDQLRMFHQCNLAATEDPVGPSEDDVKQFA
ncbi:xanthine dioxygenase, partial [Tremellales sp. Uapishka_1]